MKIKFNTKNTYFGNILSGTVFVTLKDNSIPFLKTGEFTDKAGNIYNALNLATREYEKFEDTYVIAPYKPIFNT